MCSPTQMSSTAMTRKVPTRHFKFKLKACKDCAYPPKRSGMCRVRSQALDAICHKLLQAQNVVRPRVSTG